MLPQGLPEHTLGWQILDWGTEYLAQPDGDYTGERWVYSNEQALFILWFYAVNEHGKFVYRKAVLERPKGWGKSPLLAAICCTEFMGPVKFDGWDAKGNPVGRPAPTPLVQIAAISDSQAENTYALCREMMLNGEIINEYPELDIQLSKSVYPGGRKLEKVTASPRGREGNRATFVVMDETHLWIPAEQGPELHEALSRNLTKMGGRYIETTNAPVPGQNSVAEKTHDSYEKMQSGEAEDIGLLFDTREVVIDNIFDREKALVALRYVYGDAMHPDTGWVDIENVWAAIVDPQYSEALKRRFWFNQRVRPPSAWLDFQDWKQCQTRVRKLRNSDKIALGFKGAVNRGPAALVAYRLTDGALFNMGIWEPPEGFRIQYVDKESGKNSAQIKWEVPWHEVDARVRNVMDNYDCIKLVADPTSRRDIISQWYADYNYKSDKYVEEFWFGNKSRYARAVAQFEDQVTAHRIQWDDPIINNHVLNCHTEEVPGGVIIRKDTPWSTYWIAGAQAAVLAVEAAALAIQDGALSQDEGVLISY